MQSRSKLRFESLPPMTHTSASRTSLARDRLKWEPKVALEDGLRRTIAYFREELPIQETYRSLPPRRLLSVG